MLVKHFLSALAVCCLVTSLGAQSGQSGQSGRSRPHARPAMWAALQLTESQKASVKTIHARYAPAMKLAQSQSPDSATRVFQREMADVRQLLTVSQQQSFDTYMTGTAKPRRGSVARVMPARISVPR